MGLSKHPTKREGASEEKERWRKKNKTRTEMTAEKTANRARAHSNAPPGQKDWQRDEAERGKKKKNQCLETSWLPRKQLQQRGGASSGQRD